MIGGGTSLLIVALLAGASAAAPIVHQTVSSAVVPTFTCPSNSTLTISPGAPPAGDSPLLVINLHWKVVNDEDSGFQGYWALDYYTHSVKVWEIRSGPQAGSWWVAESYSGSFVTAQGALSPQTGAVETDSGFGTLNGALNGNLTNVSFNPGANATTGSLGTFNFGGTTSDILLGTYGNGQTGPTTVFDWIDTYFLPTNGAGSASSNFATSNFGFSYGLAKLFHSGTSVNTWCNYQAASQGDIAT